jgi:hypothetical protein
MTCGPETAASFLKCRAVKCALACERQITDQSSLISEWPRFEKMVRYITAALVGGIGIEPLDRISDTAVQTLLTWN